MKKTVLLTYEYHKDKSQYGGIVLNEKDSDILSKLLEQNEEFECTEDLVQSTLENGEMTGNTLLYLAAIGLETITLQEQYTILESELDDLKIKDMDRIIDMFKEENIEQ